MWNPSWTHSCDIPRIAHMRPASDDGMLSDHSRMRLLYCTPPDPPESIHIDLDAAATVAADEVGVGAAIVAATVEVAALAAVAYHPARKP